MMDDAEVMIIAYGSVSLAAKESIRHLRADGVKAGLFRPITIWPSPAAKIKEYTDKIANVVVVELNIGQYHSEIQRASSRLDIEGLFKVNGRPISPHEIVSKVKEVF
jgi:2-oxoglutarate ferredoxin oxidoreductase subunit alpha